jgi:hypothetical protein
LAGLGVLSMVTIMDTKDGSCMGNTLDEMRPEIYNADLILYPLFDAGAAKENIEKDRFLRLCQAETAICPFPSDIIVLFDGSVMMCCSQYSNEIPMVHLGDFHNNSLSEAVSALKQNDFVFVLLSKGFGWYVKKARSLGYTLDTHYGVACELCCDIFANEKLVKELAPYVKETAGQMRLARFLG